MRESRFKSNILAIERKRALKGKSKADQKRKGKDLLSAVIEQELAQNPKFASTSLQ